MRTLEVISVDCLLNYVILEERLQFAKHLPSMVLHVSGSLREGERTYSFAISN